MSNRRFVRSVQPRVFVLALAAMVLMAATPGEGPANSGGAGYLEAANAPQGTQDATAEIKELIAKYAAAVNVEPVDINLAAQVWWNSPDVSMINPLGEERGWDEIKRDFYQNTMEAFFSQRTLAPRDISVHVYGDSGWAEFSWHFVAKSRKTGSTVESNGRETQIYRKAGPDHWVLVHVHYSAAPPAASSSAP